MLLDVARDLTAPMIPSMYVIRERLDQQQIEPHTPASTPFHMLLRPLDTDGSLVRFSAYDTEQTGRSSESEQFEVVVETLGKWQAPPTHAVYAEWRVDSEANEPKYIESRRRLFELRKSVDAGVRARESEPSASTGVHPSLLCA